MYNFRMGTLMFLTCHGIKARIHAEIAHFPTRCITRTWEAWGHRSRAFYSFCTDGIFLSSCREIFDMLHDCMRYQTAAGHLLLDRWPSSAHQRPTGGSQAAHRWLAVQITHSLSALTTPTTECGALGWFHRRRPAVPRLIIDRRTVRPTKTNKTNCLNKNPITYFLLLCNGARSFV